MLAFFYIERSVEEHTENSKGVEVKNRVSPKDTESNKILRTDLP